MEERIKLPRIRLTQLLLRVYLGLNVK